jgi:hypothetical protein
VHSAREREFANIYRGDDEARSLSDAEFVEVLAFTQAAFSMAMQFRTRRARVEALDSWIRKDVAQLAQATLTDR